MSVEDRPYHFEIGSVPWSRDEMIASIEEFSLLYDRRPVRDNEGGMMSPHLFALWSALRKLMPPVVIESGVWKGQGTWFIENACPQADIYCLDVTYRHLQYRSSRARYLEQDFVSVDWSGIPRERTVLFVDDHQSAYERAKSAYWMGFRHLLFEDNYTPGKGDVYSMKKVLMGAGCEPYSPYPIPLWIRRKAWRLLFGMACPRHLDVPPNLVDAVYLKEHTEVYYEFPPVFKATETRWGDPWEDRLYPTQEPLLTEVEQPYQRVFQDQATQYTWMCYLCLR